MYVHKKKKNWARETAYKTGVITYDSLKSLHSYST